jgi:hypothetical protein
MSIICKIFGHTRYSGWWGDGLYGKVLIGSTDGTGRTHALICEYCDRCNEEYILARFHIYNGKVKNDKS